MSKLKLTKAGLAAIKEREERDALIEAARAVMASWTKHTEPDIEVYKTIAITDSWSPGSGKPGEETYSYWSPSAALVDSGAINKLRLALEAIDKKSE